MHVCVDRGYLDYERFDRMTDDGYFFLSRLHKNAVIQEVYNFKLPENSTILSDRMVLIRTTQNRAEKYFRLLNVIDSKGDTIHLVTNRFDLSAYEISDMNKIRWAIELFFQMNQTASQHQSSMDIANRPF
jgi:putative transposase